MQVLPSVSIVVVMDAKFPSLSIAGRLWMPIRNFVPNGVSSSV
jgi:hypothetical protein